MDAYTTALHQMWTALMTAVMAREDRLMLLDGKDDRTPDEQAELDAAALLNSDMWEEY